MTSPARKSTSPSSRATQSAAGTGHPSLISLTPRDILLCIRERGITALVIAIILCTLLGTHLLRQPKIYQTQARLMFDRNERIVDITQVVDQSVGYGRNDVMFNTYLAQINSPAVIDRVVKSFTDAEKNLIWRSYGRPEAVLPPVDTLDTSINQQIKGSITASRAGDTLFLNISARGRSPEVNALIANRVARQFILLQFDRNTLSNNSAISFLEAQTEELQAKADASERALQDYREKTGMVSLDESRNIVVDRMKSLSSTVTGAQVARLEIEARLRQAESIIAGSGDPLELATTAEFSNLAAVQNQIDQLRTQKATMGERYGSKHPAMIENQGSQAALERLRSELVKVAMANLRNQQAKALSEEQELRNELQAAEKESLRLDQMSIQFNVLKRDSETNRATYAQLLNRLNETTVTAQLENSNLRLVEEAKPSTAPIAPDPQKIKFMLVALGIGVFFAYPITLELLFNRIRGWSDVENYLNLPLLSELPSFRKIPKENVSQILSRSNDDSAMEVIRSLYSQIKLSSKIDLPKTILVTSTIPGEGKSFVASNLAESFAGHGVRTLLVDVDFRRPTQHRSFRNDNSSGLLRWLQNKNASLVSPEQNPDLGILEPTPNLYLLRSGGTSRQSTEILGNPSFLALFETLRQNYDLIIFDTPPAGVFPDALILAERADELIYVVRYNHVARPAARRIVHQISQTGITQLGVVLNLMPSGLASNGYYSSYGHYGSKYYGTSDTPKS
jgi:succinoglycan biosynthesis transport protein ExoP